MSDFVNHPFFERSRRHQEELRVWTEQNHELAAAWDVALAENETRREAEEAARMAQAARHATFVACLGVGMPLRALKALEAITATQATGALPAPPEGVALLAGPPGTGKTVAAVAVAHAAMTAAMDKNPERTKENPERTAIFVRAVTLARASAYGAETQSTLERVAGTRLLILDDLGAEFASSVWDMLLFEILDTRHGAMLPTVITSNLGRDAIRQRYGERFAERVREGGAAHFLNGESLRGQS
jgi:DNA replication protein DnaC